VLLLTQIFSLHLFRPQHLVKVCKELLLTFHLSITWPSLNQTQRTAVRFNGIIDRIRLPVL